MDHQGYTVSVLRQSLAGFITRREHALKDALQKKHEVKNYGEKMQAINSLRIQLDASRNWDLKAHINWICTMRSSIMLLLPYQFHTNQAQLTYRKRITALLTWCDDQHSKHLFNQTT